MFVKLISKKTGQWVYFNSEYIKSFHWDETVYATVLDLYYGTELVLETPEEIMIALKGA